ncbi:MAG: nonstructural protein [Microviridae sp.]|nr:MAG: nonstructural protein [Microviridae sp.]
MKHSIYSIQDTVVANYAAPFMQPNDRVALRTFSNLVSDPASRISANPADYSLWKIADFDDETSVLSTFAPVLLGNGASFVKAV